MSYFGSLKTLIYTPIFKLFANGAYAVREPALIFGAASVWLFSLLLRRVAGDRGSIVGCCLLAADSLYLLTTCYDWGPVVLAASVDRGRHAFASSDSTRPSQTFRSLSVSIFRPRFMG
jgi:hypothetical protein